MSAKLEDLLGKTLIKCKDIGDEILFETTEGKKYKLYHSQDCCERVYLYDTIGNLQDLVGSPLTLAEEVSSEPPDFKDEETHDDSYTWTFYRFATVKGYVDLRWLGSSNGYYSERVDFVEVK